MDEFENTRTTAGKHPKKSDVDFDRGSNVRAQDPPPPKKPSKPESEAGHPAQEKAPMYQLLHHQEGGHYQIRTLSEEDDSFEEGYEAVGTFGSATEIEDASGDFPEEEARYIVFEDEDTGEVFVESEANITNWMDDERYDKITIFSSEEEANAYAEQRQK